MRLNAWNDRWRTYANGTALVLGFNLWASLVLLPALAVHVELRGLHLVALWLPLLILGAGLWKHSEVILLFVFPSALLLPLGMKPEMASLTIYGASRFLLVALGLVTFLFAASNLTSFHEPPKPRAVRPLRSSKERQAPRWQRRFRLYALLSVLSLIFPVVLLHRVNFDVAGAEALSENYRGRVTTVTTLFNVFVIGLWLWIFSGFFLGPLRDHRTGDRQLNRDLMALRSRSTKNAPRPSFYFSGAMALLLMVVWVVWNR